MAMKTVKEQNRVTPAVTKMGARSPGMNLAAKSTHRPYLPNHCSMAS